MHKIIDGVRLAYDAEGNGDAIVLLHGFALDRTIWDAPFAALAARGSAIRLDLRGSGESSCGEGPALMETLAGDVFELLEALGVRKTGHGRAVYDERMLCHSPQERLFIDGGWRDGLLPPLEALPASERAATLADYRAFSAAVAEAGDHDQFMIPTARSRGFTASPSTPSRSACTLWTGTCAWCSGTGSARRVRRDCGATT